MKWRDPLSPEVHILPIMSFFSDKSGGIGDIFYLWFGDFHRARAHGKGDPELESTERSETK
jgi:hypothetical protein